MVLAVELACKCSPYRLVSIWGYEKIIQDVFTLLFACFSGMNSVLVLIVLLLAVPLQLFLSHYISSIYSTATANDADSAFPIGSSTSELGGQESVKGIESVRRDALDR